MEGKYLGGLRQSITLPQETCYGITLLWKTWDNTTTEDRLFQG